MSQMWIEILEQPRVLEKCMQVNRRSMDAILTRIRNTDIHNVILAARGTSDHAAVYAKYLIEIKTGIPVTLAAPSVFTMYNKTVNMKNSLVIGISQSGRAEDVLEVLRAAKRQNVPTMAITNHEDSPMATEAEFHLFCASGLEKSVAATKTFTSQLYLLAQLAAEWSGDEGFKKDLSKVPALLTETFEQAETIEKLVTRYRFMNECIVLARGTNYAVALETALKIQETNYIRAKAFATSDFHHGPFAMIDDHMPVIIYAPKGESLKDIKEMIQKIKSSSQADVLVISNDADALSMGDCTIIIPDITNDFITPFINAVVGQMLACKLAQLRGLNPDAPRGLTKVTITR